MEPLRHPDRVLRFGPFEADLQAGVLRKRGLKIKLQAQPFQVLAALLEKPGAVVTRDELRRRLWPDDTFVDFEHGVNAAVTRLRQALGDSSEKPRYIETLSKRGYRFIGEVGGPDVVSIEEPPSQLTVAPPRHPLRKWAMLIAAAAALGALVVAASYLFVARDPVRISHPVPLTAFQGLEVDPALSPDGEQVAFAWNGEEQDNFDIYVLAIGSGSLRHLTSDPAHDLSPAWSPDGRTIAFLRQVGDDRATLLLVPSTGGPEHRIGETRNAVLAERPRPRRIASLAWSPDGRWVAASHREPEDSCEGIYLFSLTGGKRRLTAPPRDSFGDHAPAFAPDGRKLAFCRRLGSFSSEVYLLSLDVNQQPRGEALRLTDHKGWSTDPVWMHGGRDILYLSNQTGMMRREMRITSASGAPASDKPMLLEDELEQISAGRHLVYARPRSDSNIWRARIPAPDEPPGVPEPFISTTLWDGRARYSPDGRRISFVSSRSGCDEVGISNADGFNPIRMTSFGGALIGPPAWSPDGQWLVFHARPEGQSDLFVIPAAGGTPKQLTRHSSDDALPAYSHDGRWIYFDSMRSGRLEVWKMSSAGGDAVQITTGGGRGPLESPDAKTLFYVSEPGYEIRQVPVTGGVETHVAAPVCPEFGFALTTDGLFYPAPTPSGEGCEFRLLNLATGQSRPVVRLAATGPLGLVASVSPDGRYLLYEQAERPGMDLMLIENFRLR